MPGFFACKNGLTIKGMISQPDNGSEWSGAVEQCGSRNQTVRRRGERPQYDSKTDNEFGVSP